VGVFVVQQLQILVKKVRGRKFVPAAVLVDVLGQKGEDLREFFF
jgi:hypothetical protein